MRFSAASPPTGPAGPFGKVIDWLGHSLSGRIVALFLGLLLVVQAITFTAIRATIDRNARASIAKELEIGEKVLRRVLEQDTARREQGTRVVTLDYGFLDAVKSGDAITVRDALDNHRQRIGADFAALVDTRLQLIATLGGPPRKALETVMNRMSVRAGINKPVNEFIVLGDRPLQLVMVPTRRTSAPGWVLMGFALDLEEIHQLLSIHVSLQVRGSPRSPWKTAASTLPPVDTWAQKMSDELMLYANPAGQLLALSQDNHEYTARPVLLGDTEDSGMSALLIRSVNDAVAPYRELQFGLGMVTLLGVLVFGIGSVLTARHVTTPLRKLALAVERFGNGDYSTPLRGHDRNDEIGELAQSFESMRFSVARQQDQIRKLAYWDSLTGLPNRVQFRDALQAAIVAADRNGHSVSVIMLDLDRFKHVNDVLGYRFGDLMLKGVAERLANQAVRGRDLVARLAGDEFAVLLSDVNPSVDMAFTQSLAQRIDNALGGALVLEDQSVDMSASFGMAVWPHQAADADTLLNHAEVAMYAAKRGGHGPTLYDPELDATSARSLSMLSELRHAVDHGELRLYLQPKFALDGARIVGAEALMRWQHPQRGLVPPVEFIPFAEQTGFVRTLTLWIFEESLRQWPRLKDCGLEITLSVNLSTRDLLDVDLPQKFEALLVKYVVSADSFCLEITESAIMDDPQRALSTLDRLSSLGFHLSIDDFGTGYSSLAYLKRLPVDELKIDKSFVLGMENDIDDARIVRSTIDLAHGLGLTVVAEGVENAQVWDLLRELSCDEAQGYHMARPMPANEFERWSSGWALKQPSLGTGGAPDAGLLLH